MTSNYLNDKQFLIDLHSFHHREIFARITTLSWDELPLEQIEGKITGGSINVDGTSSVRRTCSLTMVAENVNIEDFHWGFKTKFKLEIGLKNTINSKYPDIIWFKQGIFVINQLSTSVGTSSYTINISGKDKMCLLNGDLGGKLPFMVSWDIEDYIDENGTLTHNKIPIMTIIEQAVRNYGNELFHNIIIKDVEDFGIEMLDYRGDQPFYLGQSDDDGSALFTGNTSATNKETTKSLSEFAADSEFANSFSYYTENSIINLPSTDKDDSKKFTIKGIVYHIYKIDMGTALGFHKMDLIYAGELTTNVGDSLTSMLDKIRDMLGDFEYFYDIDGRFTFQKKPIYIDHNWNSTLGEGRGTTGSQNTNSPDGVTNILSMQQEDADIVYSFDNSNLISSLSNTPNLSNVKNDYIVWGTHTTSSGAELPIHARYAIDEKPKFYHSLKRKKIKQNQQSDEQQSNEQNQQSNGQQPDEQNQENQQSNGQNQEDQSSNEKWYIEGGETWYVSNEVKAEEFIPNEKINENTIQQVKYKSVDWREIIYQMAIDYRYAVIKNDETVKGYHNDSFIKEIIDNNKYIDNKGEIVYLYPNGLTGYEQYYTDLIDGTGLTGVEKGFWRYLYNGKDWTEATKGDPSELIFWFDFLDPVGTDLEKYSVKVIGDRTNPVNDSNIKTMYYKDAPNILLQFSGEDRPNDPGYEVFSIPTYMEDLLARSRRSKSVLEKIDEMLYQYSYAQENISLNCLPVYFLQPNTRISVKDEDSKIYGEYLVSRLTIPLNFNGTMSITATKAVNTLQ